MKRRLTAPVVLVILNMILASLVPGGTWALDARSQRTSAVASPPTVTSVSPDRAYNYQETDVTITGTGFFTITGTGLIVPSVYLGNVPLSDVTFISSTTLTATVPTDLPGGTYTVTVTTPDSQSASLANAFTVLLSGDGSLSVWQTTSSMTMPRWSFAAVSVGSYIYALGGWPGSVERAAINADGFLGPWQATTSMTGEWGSFAAVAASGYIYALGGTGGDSKNVTRAAINADGSLGPWQAATSMTTERRFPAAVAAGGYLYAIGGFQNDCSCLDSVERAEINPDGSLGPWQAVTPMTEARFAHAAVVVGNRIYVMGGDGMSSVERATVNPDGSLGPWEAATSMTTSRFNLAAVTARGYVYALGGRESGSFVARLHDSVERAKVNADGSLSSWQAVTSMTMPRYQLAAVAARGYVYAIGGLGELVTKLSSVERAEIVDGMLPTGHRVSINDGALFTNEVTVTLTIGLEPETAQMQVSNDGGFAGVEWEPYASSKAWQITQYGSYVIPRVVYVRYKEHSGTMSAACQDDIILDVNAPTGCSVDVTPGVSGSSLRTVGAEATAMHLLSISATGDYPYAIYLPLVLNEFCTLPAGPANITLSLEATDDLSGVADMMISHLPDCKCGTWEPYSTTKAWYAPEEATTIYVKFRDSAGNVSEVVTDTISW